MAEKEEKRKPAPPYAAMAKLLKPKVPEKTETSKEE